MKLSDLETLVAAMRAKATSMGVSDPNVEFFDDDREAFQEHFGTGNPFMNMEPLPDLAAEMQDHVVLVSSDLAQRGDFAIPMRLV